MHRATSSSAGCPATPHRRPATVVLSHAAAVGVTGAVGSGATGDVSRAVGSEDGLPGRALERGRRFRPGRREATQALFIERPAPRDVRSTMGYHAAVRHLCLGCPHRKRHAGPAAPGPARARRMARAPGEARGRSRWMDRRRRACDTSRAENLRPPLHGLERGPADGLHRYGNLARANRGRACRGRGSRRGTRRRPPARHPVAATDPPRSSSTSTAVRITPGGAIAPSPGEGEAVGLPASGRLSRPKCITTEHRGKWKPGRERSMSCRCGHGPGHHGVHPYPPPHGHCPAPRPYAPPPEPRARAADAEEIGDHLRRLQDGIAGLRRDLGELGRRSGKPEQ